MNNRRRVDARSMTVVAAAVIGGMMLAVTSSGRADGLTHGSSPDPFAGLSGGITVPSWLAAAPMDSAGTMDAAGGGYSSETADSPSTRPFQWQRAFDSLGDHLFELPELVIDHTFQIGSDWDLLFPLLAAGGGSIALRSSGADHRMERDIRDNRFLGKTMDEFVYTVGGPGFHFAAAGAWYILAAGNEDPLGQERAWTMLEALSVNGALTVVLKIARNDSTPNGKRLAWPSGHTSSSFTVAAVLDEMYGPEVGIPAYLAAGFVGYRMMESGDHWPSDVMFGAVMGYIVGHHVAGRHRLPEVGGFQVVPWTRTDDGRTATGIALARTF